MRLNSLKPAKGSRSSAKRLGRGIGSGLGKTSGKGHKGQKARAGGYHKVGFEGGQMPLQRRMPKRGFRSMKQKETVSLRLGELNRFSGKVVDIVALKETGFIPVSAEAVKIYLQGELTQALTIGHGIQLSAGARKAIEAVGGKVNV